MIREDGDWTCFTCGARIEECFEKSFQAIDNKNKNGVAPDIFSTPKSFAYA
jgi:DNA-directed RNA polymerase subunit N (RpoN/RPB10)